MKLLAFGLMATLVAVALPVKAEVINSGQPVKTERINGSKCLMKITEKGKDPLDGTCQNVVQTTGKDSVNFHFDTEKETVGITYVVSNKLERENTTGRTYYPLIAVVFRTDGKNTNPIKAGGICTTDNKDMKDLAVACVAELDDGTKIQSMLIK